MPKFHDIRRLCAYLLTIAAILLSTATAYAAITEGENGRRVALVIGNSVYKTLPSLPNPANDVEEVANTLRSAGFDVTIGVNVDRIGLEDTVRRFLRSISNAEAGLIYYSGHGIQVGGQNFIVPVDATLETPYDVETQTMPLDLILNHLKQNSRVQLIFLDACRNNPFNAQKFWMAEKLEPVGATRGLARIDSDLGSLIAFSTEPGQVALDGAGALSPYSESFIKRASEPNKEIRQVLTDVRRDVIAMTGGKQVPRENSSLMDSFYFIPAPPPPSVEAMQQVSVPEGAAATKLPIAPPHDETGSTLLVTLNQLPQTGKLSFDGKPVEQGAKMPAAALTALTYDSSGVTAGTVGLIGYTVSDPYGQATQGVVAITVSADAGAKLAQLEQQKQVRLADADAYLKTLPRDVDTPIGVGPVAASLPEVPASAAEMTFKVAALPDKGTLRAGDRVIGLGHVLEAADIPALSYEPQIGTENQPFALTLQAANDNLPPATVNFKPVLDACDSAAAAPSTCRASPRVNCRTRSTPTMRCRPAPTRSRPIPRWRASSTSSAAPSLPTATPRRLLRRSRRRWMPGMSGRSTNCRASTSSAPPFPAMQPRPARSPRVVRPRAIPLPCTATARPSTTAAAPRPISSWDCA